MIFLAELGDKSQLTAIVPELWCVALLGIFAGKQLVRFIPLCWIHRTAGFMFLVFGVAALWKLKVM